MENIEKNGKIKDKLAQIEKRENVRILFACESGSFVCIGKGNEDWNYSAPHGAGRVMGRKEARCKLKLEDFEDSMKGVWSSTVCKDTLDEAQWLTRI